jgi:hypothetical protein
MIYELRTYSFAPGKLPEYLKLAEEVGTKIRGDDYGKREGSWVAEIGTLNQVWHLWRYESLDDRARMRVALGQNKAWKEDFVARIQPLMIRQEIRFFDAIRPPAPPPERGNIYELRLYRMHIGKARAWADLFTGVMPAREKYSRNVGILIGEAPEPHSVAHFWAYKDLNDRMRARSAALQDPEWQAFLAKGTPLLAEMQSTILVPTAFSPMG